MANGAAFDDAVRLGARDPSLDIGCHLVLVGGRSLLTGRPLPATVPQLLAALARREIRLYDELAAQVRKVVAAGIEPTHLDTHKHTHLAPPGAGRGGAARARSSASAGCGGRSIFR